MTKKTGDALAPDPGAAIAARYAALRALAAQATQVADLLADQVPPLMDGDDIYTQDQQEQLLAHALSCEPVQALIRAKSFELRPGVADPVQNAVTPAPPARSAKTPTSTPRTVGTAPVPPTVAAPAPPRPQIPQGHHVPLTATGMIIGSQGYAYTPPPITRVPLLYGTTMQIRVLENGKETSKTQREVYCIRDDATWERALRHHQELTSTLEALADQLRTLGAYLKRLDAAGGHLKHKRLLSETVIRIQDPDTRTHFWSNWKVPEISRSRIYRHTAKSLVFEPGDNARPADAGNCFVCPDDAAWAETEALHGLAVGAFQAWEHFKKEIGTYEAAAGDGRYGPVRLKSKAAPAGVPDSPPPMLDLFGI